MRIAMMSLVVVGLLACAKDRPVESPSSTTTTSADVPPSGGMQMVEHVRSVLRAQYPALHAEIDGLVIAESDGTITLAGEVADERARAEILETVRGIEGVRDVRDVIRVKTKKEGR